MKLDRFPFVSVIMPVFNGEKYLNEAIESILNQTYTNFEFIIINDGSTDTSEEIILSYKDSRIVYIKNPENYKLIQTLNIGFSLAKGRYIARMDADDISHPDRLQKQVQFLDINEDYGLVGSGVNLLHGANKSQLLYHTDYASLKFALAFYCPFIHPSVMLRKEVIKSMDPVFDERFLHAEDYELWTRLAFRTKMANLPEYLLDYRVHDSQISSQHNSHQTEIANKIRRNYLENYFIGDVEEYLFTFKLSETEKSLTSKLIEVKKIYQLNQKNTIFGGDNFNCYLIKLWKDLFIESSKLTLKDYFYLVFNTITYRSNWSLKQFFLGLVKLIR
jgi:glycosyltransferase involved in cell wall biosynthesis